MRRLKTSNLILLFVLVFLLVLKPLFQQCVKRPVLELLQVQTEFGQIAFQPPHPQANGRFVGAIVAENLSIFENSGCDFGNGYFDDYYGQTLFLDCILMDIMIYNGEIWCKLSALVMVYIH